MIAQSQIQTSDRANFNHLVGDIAWFGLALAATTRFLSVYAIRLGASAVDLGWISALPALIVVITSSLGAWWTRRFKTSERSLFLPGLGMRFLFLLPALAPFLPLRWQPLWLILAVSIPAFPQGIASVSFFVMFRDAIHPSSMIRLLSHRQLALNLCLGGAALVFGVWLEKAPFPLNYQVMFLLAFAFSLISLIHCISVQTPPLVVTQSETPLVRKRGTNPWRSSGFQRVAVVSVVIQIAFTILVPVLPLYLVDRMGADEGFMAVFALIELAAGAVASVLAPRIRERIGTRPMIAFMIAGTALNAIIIAFAPNLYVALFAAIFSGACWTAGAGVGLFQFFVENTPADEMPAYSTAYSQINGLAVFAGPMLGSLLASSGMSLVLVILFGAVLRLIAAPLVDTSLVFGQPARQSARAAASRALTKLRAASHIAIF